MCLVVNDLDWRIVLFDGFEIGYAEIIGKGVGGIVIVGIRVNWLEALLVQFAQVLPQDLPLYFLEGRLLELERKPFDP